MSKGVIVLLVAAVLLSVAVLSAQYGDDIQLLFNSWLEGKPKALVKLHIHIPSGYGNCSVIVHRFPTKYNPTADGYTTLIHRGKSPSGRTVTVKDVINMYQVGTVESEEGERHLYDSPEYYVGVICVNKNDVYSFSKIVQTIITKPITDVDIHAELKKRSRAEDRQSGSNFAMLASSEPVSCSITISETSGDPIYGQDYWAKGYCITPTKLTYLNSIPGLKTAFGITGLDSAMYLEGWVAACYATNIKPCPSSFWDSAGKKLAIAVTTEKSDYISNGQRAVVWGNVYYQYEYYAWYDSDFYMYFIYEIIYPKDIRGLHPLQIIGSYTPPSSPPPYAGGPFKGDRDIYFPADTLTDIKLPVSTSISVSYTIAGWPVSISISVSPYKAESPQYKSPYVSIIDISGKNYGWYYWWYKDDDPLNYEIEFYG
ncbi:hypothetical protein [Pyrobaculum aerophilum]|uniref:Uncharacterized protein n=1 Tax=Pyrobaculum aerophilum TaxID=13773 RepID=A0A371R3V1_9CREN|nr:hypothetical protein [Pyrobaculum aerophilum]RFA96810.1 hypothetical protein CGL52_10400 [Pyrobaculum aerophilum]RFA98476.1 hypothetical protein CGL51_00055 [Pyrobaculum aerophilum]